MKGNAGSRGPNRRAGQEVYGSDRQGVLNGTLGNGESDGTKVHAGLELRRYGMD
jgi:hypothetical protein